MDRLISRYVHFERHQSFGVRASDHSVRLGGPSTCRPLVLGRSTELSDFYFEVAKHNFRCIILIIQRVIV